MRFCWCELVAASAVLVAASVDAAADRDGKWSPSEHGQYKAQQIGDTVVLVAYGTHSTGGYKTNLRRLPIEIYPPQFEFLEQKPEGFTAQVITPFAAISHFKASGAVKSVIVHDGNGNRTVKVTVSASDAGPLENGVGYLTPDGKLARTLVFKDSQIGFAGKTGYTWTIETDGSWKRQTFLNRLVREPDQSGKLTRNQLRRLARVLKANRMLDLPDRLGDKPITNPKVLTLAFGSKQSEFVLRGGSDLPNVNEGNENSNDAGRFVQIVIAIRKLLDAKSEG